MARKSDNQILNSMNHNVAWWTAREIVEIAAAFEKRPSAGAARVLHAAKQKLDEFFDRVLFESH